MRNGRRKLKDLRCVTTSEAAADNCDVGDVTHDGDGVVSGGLPAWRRPSSWSRRSRRPWPAPARTAPPPGRPGRRRRRPGAGDGRPAGAWRSLRPRTAPQAGYGGRRVVGRPDSGPAARRWASTRSRTSVRTGTAADTRPHTSRSRHLNRCVAGCVASRPVIGWRLPSSNSLQITDGRVVGHECRRPRRCCVQMQLPTTTGSVSSAAWKVLRPIASTSANIDRRLLVNRPTLQRCYWLICRATRRCHENHAGLTYGSPGLMLTELGATRSY